MESFGELIRRLRESRGLLLRELASQLDIDPSLLSRIECNKKRGSRELIVRLAALLEADEKELIVAFLSDNLVAEVEGEEFALHAISVAEEKIRYRVLEIGRAEK